MASTDQRPPPAAPRQDHPERADNLLPADDSGDGRFEAAEEVNLDQQSDAARRVGQAPEHPAPEVPAGPGGGPGKP